VELTAGILNFAYISKLIVLRSALQGPFGSWDTPVRSEHRLSEVSCHQLTYPFHGFKRIFALIITICPLIVNVVRAGDEPHWTYDFARNIWYDEGV